MGGAAAALLAACAALWSAPAAAELPETLRVGTSGDYPPFSLAAGGRFEGFDLQVARAYARDRGLGLQTVRFQWPALLSDLAAGRFDVAMSGVTIRPERSLAGIFTVPVMESGAVALVRPGSGLSRAASLDVPGVRIAVNAGGHLEWVARHEFPRAEIRPIGDNARVLESLLGGEADAVLTDSLEAPLWMRRAPGLVRLGPFTRDLKAYLLHPDQGALAADLDDWLLEREADGTLPRLRRQALGGPGAATAQPLSALLAAMDERLRLMPLVAEAKRGAGAPVRAPVRESRVIAAAVEAMRAAARRTGRPPLNEGALAELFRVQMTAAREIQEAVLALPPAADGPQSPNLPALRAALLRIGDRIAGLALRLPDPLDPAEVDAAASKRLGAPHLTEASRRRLSQAVSALARARAEVEPLSDSS